MNDRYEAFRLNFEQQQKRAKELLKAARRGEDAALVRFTRTPLKLAEAQYLIARELRFENWAALKRHAAMMAHERERMAESVVDAELRTLHIRCGSDLKESLQVAGLRGDFYEHSYPYVVGPVREGADALPQRAQFIVDSYLPYSGNRQPVPEFAQVLNGLEHDERQLHESAHYERVVIWSEADSYDQLVLIRLLGHYAQHRRPARLELINTDDFPGTMSFLGLGQLPPEALRVLWGTRRRASPAQLQLGLAAWKALVNPDPRPLAALMRGGTPALPLLGPALHCHLRQLPAITTGLSLTEEVALQSLSVKPCGVFQLVGRMIYSLISLSGQGDTNILNRLLAMEQAREKPFIRRPGPDRDSESRAPWSDVLEITELGRALLRGEVDFHSLHPPPRWVGGVRIASGHDDWRWDEARREAVRRDQGPSTS
ncbi:MAG TPA: DUF1835 domain-containing protein [Steroidobacteraceae bacterium]